MAEADAPQDISGILAAVDREAQTSDVGGGGH